MLCAYCHVDKQPSDFRATSKRKCRSCISDAQRVRYQTDGGKMRAANRRAAHRLRFAARRAQEPSHSVAVLAYAAGLIDGEGCVTIARRSAAAPSYRQGMYRCVVYVNSTTKPMIDWLVEHWGGAVCYVPAKPEKNRKEQWRWQIQSNAVLRMLDDILPYMVVKKRVAQLVRRFQRYVQVSGRKRTEKVDRVQHHVWVEVRKLNHRGVREFIEPEARAA